MPNTFSKIVVGIRSHPIKFGVLWFIFFILLLSLASGLGLITTPSDNEVEDQRELITEGGIIPERGREIIIEKIGVEVDLNEPESRRIDVLNESLKDGAVQFPGSGLAGGKNNLFIFGHSSHLPVVLNQNYKAFNDLEDLVIGDKIKIRSDNTEFVYEVFSVEEADAADFRVDFNTERRLLTLSTCNNFGDLDDRFVVQAELIGTRSLR